MIPMRDAILPWAKKEALAGDRLPYLALVDENVVLLRDGPAPPPGQ